MNENIKRTKKPVAVDIGRRGQLIRQEIAEHIAMLQLVTGLNSFCVAAVVGDTVGQLFACTDCSIEKDLNVKADSEESEPLKRTFLLNFDVGYNEHRSKHENKECTVKPEPKIV